LWEVFLKDCCPWKYGWGHITPLSSFKALQIRLSTGFFGESGEDSLKFRPVIEVVQMDQFMEENVIKGIGGSALQAI
jgi:hypothetical protein